MVGFFRSQWPLHVEDGEIGFNMIHLDTSSWSWVDLQDFFQWSWEIEMLQCFQINPISINFQLRDKLGESKDCVLWAGFEGIFVGHNFRRNIYQFTCTFCLVRNPKLNAGTRQCVAFFGQRNSSHQICILVSKTSFVPFSSLRAGRYTQTHTWKKLDSSTYFGMLVHSTLRGVKTVLPLFSQQNANKDTKKSSSDEECRGFLAVKWLGLGRWSMDVASCDEISRDVGHIGSLL